MWEAINNFLVAVDDKVWGVPLMVLIIAGGVLLTSRLGFLQVRRLPLALKWMFKNEEEGDGEISSFAALCTALSATIGTGNIVGVATAVCAGGPGALFWMIVAASLEWQQNFLKVFWQLNTVWLQKTDTALADHSIISKKVWDQNGNGLARSLHSSVFV